jgi:acetyl-CoA carboxylase carboxyl transferase subunit alpha
MPHYLDFEQPIAELEGKIEELRHLTGEHGLNIAEEVGKLQAKVDRQLRTVYGKLTPWQKVQVARHPERPHFTDVVGRLVTEFTPLAGDRLYGEDCAIVGGLGRLDGRACVVLGHEKGADTDDRVKRNFGMAKPEGYRKARRLMKMADRFKLPVVALVDTPGAYPGVEAEARGQAEAIARCLETCLAIGVPFVAAVIGEGGSGGAIAIAAANRVIMLEHAVYSVISPEGCASILWRSAEQAKDAADALKLTAQDLLKFGVIDVVVPEPMGGAHRDRDTAIDALGAAIRREIDALADDEPAALRARRREKYLEMGRNGVA